jgi:hypothetical protein
MKLVDLVLLVYRTQSHCKGLLENIQPWVYENREAGSADITLVPVIAYITAQGLEPAGEEAEHDDWVVSVMGPGVKSPGLKVLGHIPVLASAHESP